MNNRYERYQYIYGSTARAVEVAVPEPEKRQEQQRTAKPKVKSNPRVLEYNGRFTVLLAVSIMAVVVICVSYLYGRSMINDKMSSISRKQTALATMKSENQSKAANLDKKVDYDALKQRAAELGMVVPGEENTIYYEGTPSDFVRQYADIPGAN